MAWLDQWQASPEHVYHSLTLLMLWLTCDVLDWPVMFSIGL
jgi:hypothetical protein